MVHICDVLIIGVPERTFSRATTLFRIGRFDLRPPIQIMGDQILRKTETGNSSIMQYYFQIACRKPDLRMNVPGIFPEESLID